MITLNRLYSRTGLFDEVTFHNGINIILGKYSGEDSGAEINGVGKSSLVRLIDYALLSDSAKSFFSSPKFHFLSPHDVTLEFSIDGKQYRVRRQFEHRGEVRFGEANGTQHQYTEPELRAVLQNKFFPLTGYDGGLGNAWFRALLKFFIKDDLNHHERSDPVNFIHKQQKPIELHKYNFYLLGIPNEAINHFDQMNEEMRGLKKEKKILEKKVHDKTGKNVPEVKMDIIKIEGRIKTLQKGIEKYEFLESYKEVEKRLTELAGCIAGELKTYHQLDKKLKDFKESYRLEHEINVDKIKALYHEIDKNLGNFVQQKLDDVLQFRKDISENRKRFLQDREKKLQDAIEKVLKTISGYEEERKTLYGILDEKKALDSIKNTYGLLIEEKSRLKDSTIHLKDINDLETSISIAESSVADSRTGVIKALRDAETTLENLRKLFFDIINHAVFVDSDIEGAYLDIKTDGSSKTIPARIVVNVPKSESLGKSRFKVLAYDLLVFLNIIRSNRDLPHFLVHDGVFHSIDPRTAVKLLNYIHSQWLNHQNFQYIATFNEEEIHIPGEKKSVYGTYDFDWEKLVVARYEDVPAKMIFRRNFT